MELNNVKLMNRFTFEKGGFTIFLRLADETTIKIRLNDYVWMGDLRLCPITSVEDLQAFLTGIQAVIVDASGVIDLNEFMSLPHKIPESEFVKEIIQITHVDLDVLRTNTVYRGRPYVVSRQLHMMVRHQCLKMSLEISGTIYNKDHATVLHGIKTITNIRETDYGFRARTEKLFEMINSVQ